MYLKLLTVETEDKKRTPCFHWEAHHVKEIFMENLPRNFNLGCSSKVAIVCSPLGNKPQFIQVLGVIAYFVEDFDFETFWDSKPEIKENIILDLIEDTLCKIAEIVGSNCEVIASTCAAVRRCNFRMIVEIKRLALTLSDHSLILKVYRNISKEDGETWTVKALNKKKEIVDEIVIGERPEYLDLRPVIRSSEIENNDLVFKDKYERIFRTVSISHLL